MEDIESLEKIALKAKKISDVIASFPGEIRIISHYDCDGICSAAILVKALLREGKAFHLSFIKQLYEEDIIELKKENRKLIVFTDMGSGQLGIIQKHLLGKGNKIIISDHHQVQGEVISDNVLHLNPVDFGIEENISGSGMAYLIARALCYENMDLSELGVIGAIGDSQIGSIGADWGLFGLNKEILKDAEKTGKIKIKKGLRLWGRNTRPVHKALEYSVDPYIPGVSGSESASVHFLQEIGIRLKDEAGKWRTLNDLSHEEVKTLASGIIKQRVAGNEDNPEHIFGDVYELLTKPEYSDANEFATLLNACGKTGNGFLGVALCLNDPLSFSEVKGILDNYRKDIGKALNWIYKNKESIRKTENANYITAGRNIPEHVASNVISIISKSALLPDKPTFAFVDAENGTTKISARLSDSLVKQGLNLKDIMAQSASEADGEGGGHAGAAGAKIPRGNEEMFINTIEKIMKNRNVKKEVKSNGATKSEGSEGRAKGEAKASIKTIREKRDSKKVEGKGLVRYLGS